MLARHAAHGLTAQQVLESVQSHAQDARDIKLTRNNIKGLGASMLRVILPAQFGLPQQLRGVAKAAVAHSKVLQHALEAGGNSSGPVTFNLTPSTFCAWRTCPEAALAEHAGRALGALEVRTCRRRPLCALWQRCSWCTPARHWSPLCRTSVSRTILQRRWRTLIHLLAV